MKTITLGSGFVANHLPYEQVLTRINSISDVDMLINKYKPEAIVNCIGKTGRPNIDWCQSHKEDTAFSNTAVPIILADACAKHSIHLVQVGSGCIFFGESPYKGEKPGALDPGWTESDFANPESFYSKSKYACDLAIGDMKNVTVLRIRMPISTQNNPRNLINKLRGYNKIIDIPNSMTFMSDFVRCVDWAIKGLHTGIFHVVNPEPITAVQIMTEYQKYVPEHKFEIISEFDLDKLTLAKRSNCILSSQKLRSLGFEMTASKDALVSCMADYINNIKD